MSVLKIKDENEAWIPIPSIVGEPAGFGTVSATVDANHGTPAVTVTASGDDTAKNFAFAFSNLQPAPYDDSVIQARMDSFTNLAEGSTTGDAELIDGRVGDDGVTYNNIGTAIRTQFSDVKSEFTNLNSGVLNDSHYRVTPDITSNGWKLVADGCSASDANYKMLKYAVVAGIDISVWCFDSNIKMQFQDDYPVPSVDNTHIVSPAIIDGYCGKLSVPVGATYLIVSVKSGDNLSGVYFDSSALHALTADATQVQLENYNLYGKYYIDAPIESGGIADVDGGIKVNSLRLRTKNMLYSITKEIGVEIPSTLDWFIHEYDETFTRKKTSPTWISGTTYSLTYPYFKIVIRKKDNSSILVTDADDFKVFSRYYEPSSSIIPVRLILERKIISGIGHNFKLDATGVSIEDSDYDLVKYDVSTEDEVYVSSKHIFQFQEGMYVPSENNTYLVGNPVVGLFSGKISVPNGATHIIISVAKSDSESGAWGISTYESNKNLTASVSPTLLTERYIGHRGGAKSAPENTIPALEQGYANGFKFLELDIQFTSDGIPVILHDTTINRTGRNADGSDISGTINIGDITYAESQEYDFGIYCGAEYAGTKLPKLEDVLLWAKKHGCCIECDISGTENMNASKATVLYNTVKNLGMNGSAMFTGHIDTALNYFNGYNDICVCCSGIGKTDNASREASVFLQKSLYTMCSVQYPYLTTEQVNYMHQHGMATKGFTIGSPSDANAVWEYGVDKMILDGVYPNEL